jgi:Fic family protein
MVQVKKIKKGIKEYYILSHSYRDGKSVKSITTYLGKEEPKNIEEIKKNFMHEFYAGKFLKKIDKIRKNFLKEYRKIPKSAKEKQEENFAIKFTYNSQRIEGSTLTLKETADLFERGITPSSRSIRDVKEAEAHKEVFENMMGYEKDLNHQMVLFWNKKLLERTKSDVSGKIRNHHVAIARSRFVPPMPSELEFLLKDFFDWYNKFKKKLHPVELAALVHLKFVTIHPFGDGNGRISRIMMNFVLHKGGFPMLDIPYSKRTSYYNALERSQMKKEDNIFLQWFYKRYLEEYKKYLGDE